MRAITDNWKWALSLIISLTLVGFTAFSYMNSNFVQKDSFHLICERLIIIDKKLDNLIERHLKE